MPADAGGSTLESFGFLIDRIQKRVNSWNNKILSSGGKEVLIKSILAVIHLYPMQCFLLPKTTLAKINSVVLRFWWRSSSNNAHHVHCLKSSILFQSKDNGGMGFKNMFHFNRALLAKLACKIYDQPDLLVSRIPKCKYFRDCSFFDSILDRRPSKIRRSAFSVKDLILRGSFFDSNRNCIVWNECNGAFSVKSAYTLSVQITDETVASSVGKQSDVSVTTFFWKHLWRAWQK